MDVETDDILGHDGDEAYVQETQLMYKYKKGSGIGETKAINTSTR